MNWINAKDRLPEINLKCLIKIVWKVPTWSTDFFLGSMDEEGVFCDEWAIPIQSFNDHFGPLIQDAYWMPIDDIPKPEMK